MSTQQIQAQLSSRLQNSKPLVLKLHSILTWEQDIYPILVSAVVTIAFLIIHCLNSHNNILATFSYLGIAAAVFNLALPTICSGTAAKTGDKDNQKFDKICLDLAKVYTFFQELCAMCCSLQTSKPKVFYPSLLTALLVLAYIGNKINNLFLTYLVTLILVLYPGLERKGYTQKAMEFVYAKMGSRPSSSSSSSSASASGGDRKSSGKRN